MGKSENESDLSTLFKAKTNIPLAHQEIVKGCPLCDCKIRLYDVERAERVCNDCGYVYDDGCSNSNLELYDGRSTELMYVGKGFTEDENQFRRKNGQFLKLWKSQRERRQITYHNVVLLFKSILGLSDIDVIDVESILSKAGSLKRIHPRLKYETIILGVCCFILHENKGRQIVFRDKLFKDYELTRHKYEIISNNIIKHKLIKRCVYD